MSEEVVNEHECQSIEALWHSDGRVTMANSHQLIKISFVIRSFTHTHTCSVHTVDDKDVEDNGVENRRPCTMYTRTTFHYKFCIIPKNARGAAEETKHTTPIDKSPTLDTLS